MSPAPALPSDLLSALSGRRTAPLLKAQEHARGAEFGQTLRKKQSSDAEERLSEPSRAGETRSQEPAPEEVEEPTESGASGGESVEDDRPDAAVTAAGEDVDRSQNSPHGIGPETTGTAAGGVQDARPDPLGGENAPDQPVTIRLLNQQLLHGGLVVRLDPRDTLGKPTAFGLDAGGSSEGVIASEEKGRRSVARGRVESDREGMEDRARGGEPTVQESPVGESEPGPRQAGERITENDPKRSQKSSSAQHETATGAATDISPTATPRPEGGAVSLQRPLMDGPMRVPLARAAAEPEGMGSPGTIVGVRTGGSGREAGMGGAGTKPQAGPGLDGRSADPAGAGEANSVFRQQLARGLGAAVAQARAGKGAQELVLHLQPASLGQVKVRVAFDQSKGGVSARFEVSSREARQIVDGSLEQLRNSLESRGVGVADLEVRVAARERPVSDPLGLISGTPYADAKSDAGASLASPPVSPEGGPGGGADGGVAVGGEQGFQATDDRQTGQDARTNWGQGSMDAPRSSSGLEDASAELLAATEVSDVAWMMSRDEGGALRLVIDAIA